MTDGSLGPDGSMFTQRPHNDHHAVQVTPDSGTGTTGLSWS
jgi:hypothetical protein